MYMYITLYHHLVLVTYPFFVGQITIYNHLFSIILQHFRHQPAEKSPPMSSSRDLAPQAVELLAESR